jgi:hypothetical protein
MSPGMFLLTLLLSCAYTVEDWWSDQADGFCSCNYTETYDACYAEQMASYQATDYWDACFDDPAPVERADVKSWYDDYTENCERPALEEPAPEDAGWYQSCDG